MNSLFIITVPRKFGKEISKSPSRNLSPSKASADRTSSPSKRRSVDVFEIVRKVLEDKLKIHDASIHPDEKNEKVLILINSGSTTKSEHILAELSAVGHGAAHCCLYAGPFLAYSGNGFKR